MWGDTVVLLFINHYAYAFYLSDNSNTQGTSDAPYPPKRKKMTTKEESASSTRSEKNKGNSLTRCTSFLL